MDEVCYAYRPLAMDETKTQRKLVKANSHEWISFEDPQEDRTWVFDVTFLVSNWQCIYKGGCPGIEEDLAPDKEFGCCVHGAHMSDSQDFAKVKKNMAKLTDSQWQFKEYAKSQGGPFTKDPDSGADVTKVVDGACIFLNRPEFPGGAGCAFHRAGLEAGERPLDWKPEVCWQVPIRREDQEAPDGHIITTISQWDRKHWGDGGHEFGWWCTEAPEAFTARNPAYLRLKDELVEMTSKTAFSLLCSYLEHRSSGTKSVPLKDHLGNDLGNSEGNIPGGAGDVTFLPHPALRRKK